jgi:nucleotide-binding universal stress UspA family protein
MTPWKRILVATDFSPPARVALRSAQALANQVGGTLEVLHVVERFPPRRRMLLGSLGSAGETRERLRRAEAHLERMLGRLAAPGVAVEGAVRLGRPWEEILAAAREVEADLICLGNSGHSRFQRLMLGSTAENLVRRSPVPVLVTRRRPLGRIRKVLLPVDFSARAEEAVRFAAERLARGARLAALHVVPPPPPIPDFPLVPVDERALKAELRSFLARARASRASAEVAVFEDPVVAILRRAKRLPADLIVLSSHTRRGLDRFLLGAVAERVVRHAECPVLVLPGPGRSPTSRARRRGASRG